MSEMQELSPVWELVSDQVMGGISAGSLSREDVAGRHAARLTGTVSLENNGGFLQMAFDVASAAPDKETRGWLGLEIDVFGNDELYDIRLRTDHLTRPWQSFRTQIKTERAWQTHRLTFAEFKAHRTDAPFVPDRLRRIGFLGVGRAFDVDLAVSAVRLFR